MNLDRLNNGEMVSGGSAILLFVFLFFQWYGLGVSEQSNLLGDLRLFDDGGNAWQTLEVTPIFLALVITVTVGAVLQRLIGRDWEPPAPERSGLRPRSASGVSNPDPHHFPTRPGGRI
jgi:hypothetical protein